MCGRTVSGFHICVDIFDFENWKMLLSSSRKKMTRMEDAKDRAFDLDFTFTIPIPWMDF